MWTQVPRGPCSSPLAFSICVLSGLKQRGAVGVLTSSAHVPLGVVGQLVGVTAGGRPSCFLGNLGIAMFMES